MSPDPLNRFIWRRNLKRDLPRHRLDHQIVCRGYEFFFLPVYQYFVHFANERRRSARLIVDRLDTDLTLERNSMHVWLYKELKIYYAVT